MLSLKQITYSLFLGCLVTCKIAAAQLHPDNAAPKAMPEVEFGIDRSNMATEWTLSPPAEPNIYPFNGPYNGAGIFEARRTAVFDGIARLHPQWFRDGFGGDTPTDIDLFVDTVTQVHARGIKMLAVIGHAGSDFDPKDFINPKDGGCQWGTFPLSKINLTKLEHRLRTHFDALKKAGRSVDAFEVDNELDLLQRRRYAKDLRIRRASLAMVSVKGTGPCFYRGLCALLENICNRHSGILSARQDHYLWDVKPHWKFRRAHSGSGQLHGRFRKDLRLHHSRGWLR